MTPTPTARVTPKSGHWYFHDELEESGGEIRKTTRDESLTIWRWTYSGEIFGHPICEISLRNADPERTRDLIIAAVNACFALNPTDPLSAAQHLEALVKAVQGHILAGHGTDPLRVALSKVTGS